MDEPGHDSFSDPEHANAVEKYNGCSVMFRDFGKRRYTNVNVTIFGDGRVHVGFRTGERIVTALANVVVRVRSDRKAAQ
jgi:hypothetical protein